ncbi:MAG: RNA 3'-phosphate cyclase [Candidatus Lokiarchaeota archaeon]|nr:RNA 3'-phosphate cyclase [Candidatus Lokiarchaeota archaeon]
MIDDRLVKIDGSIGEGGGSILRLASGFSVLFTRPIEVYNIRSSRSKPGLRLQHVLGLQALRDLTDGHLSPVKVGTTKIKFTPGNVFRDELNIKIRTAGSIALLSQSIQNAAIFTNNSSELDINYTGGGTFGLGAPDPYYLNNITYYFFSKMGYKCQIDVLKNGFYPKGGAKARLHIDPLEKDKDQLTPVNFEEQGNLIKIGGDIIVSHNLKKPKVAERIHNGIVKEMAKFVSQVKFDIHRKYINSLNPGVGLNIWAQYDSGAVVSSGTILGKRGLPSEKLARIASRALIEPMQCGATVDEYLGDQIIPLLYLCEEPSSIMVSKISSHMQTNLDLLDMFSKRKYEIKKIGKAFRFRYFEQ